MMDLAAYSPRKLQSLHQVSPRGTARKRSLFPSNSPPSPDLGVVRELVSDDSEVYSPLPASPSPSLSSPLHRPVLGLCPANRLDFGNYLLEVNSDESPLKSHNNGKENSLTKSHRKPLLDKENFDERFATVLSNSPKKQKTPVKFERSSNNFITPKKQLPDKAVRRSPRSATKDRGIIRPTSFYGKLAPVLANNQTNRIQGMKIVFKPSQSSKAKTKLLFEDKPRKKRERSRSVDMVREAKKRKPVFTGVRHAIPRPKKYSPPPVVTAKQESIREKARKATDLTRTPYGMKKNKPEGWVLRFTKPMRYEESPNMGTKRKFFKSSVKDSPGSTCTILSPELPKRRKLLDPSKDYLDDKEPQAKHNDIGDLIQDFDNDKLQDKPEVDDILLRLEEDEEEDEEAQCREAERQMLMNLLEDSPGDMDTLSDCTASLDINDSFGPANNCRWPDMSLVDGKDAEATPKRMFPVFSSLPGSGSSSGSSGRQKWRGMGENQLQIDAGQRIFGPRTCSGCGMIYQAGVPEDEIQHTAFHNNLTTLKHTGWKNERVVGAFGVDYVIMITGDDPKSWQQKGTEVLALVDRALGIIIESPAVKNHQKVFLYISEKRIVGCVVANPITRGYRMISSESDVDICSEESYPARCGVSRMWTLFSHRRHGVASNLMDCVRRNFMYGCILSRDDIAFSIPTPDGKQFAAKYMDTPNFLVYTGY